MSITKKPSNRDERSHPQEKACDPVEEGSKLTDQPSLNPVNQTTAEGQLNGQPQNVSQNAGQPIIPPSDSQNQMEHDSDEPILEEWEKPLDTRGIRKAARAAGWQPSTRKGIPGWAYPVCDANGQVHLLPDGKPAQRWKNLNSNPDEGDDKNLWGYSDSKAGEAKPAGCDYYHVPGINLPQDIAAADGVLIIACGEPDMLTFHAAGMQNVTSFFGETLISPSLPEQSLNWGTNEIWYFADNDSTGGTAAEKLATILRYSDISLRLYDLPTEMNGKLIKDINDLFCALDCDPEAFKDALSRMEYVTLDNSSHNKPAKRPKLPRPDQDLSTDFYTATEEALGIQEYKSNGWSKAVACPFKIHEHDDRRPAAHYHKDKHILHCFKCGETWLSVEVGKVLGLEWRGYIQRDKAVRRNGKSQTHDLLTTGTSADDESNPKPPPPTDDELGDVLIAEWDDNRAYFLDQWHCYRDGYWQPEETIDGLLWEALRQHKYRGIKPNKGRVNSVEHYLISKLRIDGDCVDNGDGYINLQNGLYNLDADGLEPHRRDLYLTSQLGFAYDADADCPAWLHSLLQWLTTPDGQPDQDLIALLQEAVGYSLTTDTSFEKAFWLYGPAGSGKSTVLRVLSALGGSSHITVDLSLLDKNQYQLADLPGKRIITCTEARVGSTLADNVLKALISGEDLVGRQPYGRNFRFKPNVKLWWAMNERPTNRDSSEAIYRRLIHIPFRNAVPADQQDRHLFVKLEAEMAGIFNWALVGLRRLRQVGRFTSAAQAAQALEDYRLENDVERIFVDDAEWCTLDAGCKTQSNDLYLAYKAWCIRFGHEFKTRTAVARDWERLGFSKVQNGLRYYQGIGLTKEAESAAAKLK